MEKGKEMIEENTGYKYTVDNENVYIIRLLYFNIQEDPITNGDNFHFYTTDCIIDRITNANTGEEAEIVNGEAYFAFTYKKGKRVTGETIYFCKHLVILYNHFLRMNKCGKIEARAKKPFTDLSFLSAIGGAEIFPDVFSTSALFEYIKSRNYKINLDECMEEYYSYLDNKYFPYGDYYKEK